MADRVDLHEPERLLELGTSIEALSRAGVEALQAAQAALAASRSRVREARDGVEREVRAAEQDVLREREEDGDEAAAERRLDEARARLSHVRASQRRVEEAAERYEDSARRFRPMLSNDARQGVVFLQTKLSALEPYFRARPASLAAWKAFTGGGLHPKRHGWDYEKARQRMLIETLADPLAPSWVVGWIRQEVRRCEVAARAVAAGERPPGGNRRRLRTPRGLQAGHRVPGLDTWQNLRFEDGLNNGRPARARRLGIAEKVR